MVDKALGRFGAPLWGGLSWCGVAAVFGRGEERGGGEGRGGNSETRGRPRSQNGADIAGGLFDLSATNRKQPNAVRREKAVKQFRLFHVGVANGTIPTTTAGDRLIPQKEDDLPRTARGAASGEVRSKGRYSAAELPDLTDTVLAGGRKATKRTLELVSPTGRRRGGASNEHAERDSVLALVAHSRSRWSGVPQCRQQRGAERVTIHLCPVQF